jgi:hypothetical protein
MEVLIYTVLALAVLVVIVSLIMKLVFKRSLVEMITDWLAQFL